MPPNPWPSDIEVPFEGLEVFTSLAEECRMFVGTHVVDVLRTNSLRALQAFLSRAAGEQFEQLEEEVKSNRCTLIMTGPLQVLRILNVTVVEIKCGEHLLVSVGKHKSGSLSCCCELPGGSNMPGESTQRALKRLLRRKLWVYATKDLVSEGFHTQTLDRESKSFGIPSKYLQTVHRATLPSARLREHGCPLFFSQTKSYLSGWYASVDPVLRRVQTCESIVENSTKLGSARRVSGRSVSSHPASVDPMDPTSHPVMAVLAGDGTTYFYAWILDSDFRFLSSSSGADKFRHWFESLRLEDPSCPGALRQPDLPGSGCERQTSSRRSELSSVGTVCSMDSGLDQMECDWHEADTLVSASADLVLGNGKLSCLEDYEDAPETQRNVLIL